MGVGCQGGKIRLWGGEQLLDSLVKCGLIVLGRQQVIGAGFEHQGQGRFGLGVQRIQRHHRTF